jgi:DNA polymerase-3 subunit gamma/tau
MLNLVDEEVYFQISDAILNKTYITAFEVTKKVYENGWNFIDFMNGLIEHFRNIMTVRLTGNSKLIEASEISKVRYLNYRERYTESDLLRILNFLSKTFQELKQISNHRLKIEVSLCHLIGIESSSSIRDVLNNLEEIKKKTPLIISKSPQSALIEDKKQNTLNNIQAAQKSSASETALASELTENDDFQKVKAKWDKFVEEVSSEKFIAGSALKITRITGLDGNKLFAEISDPYLKSTINQNKDYFTNKTLEIFGKSLYFTFDQSIADKDESVSSQMIQSNQGDEFETEGEIIEEKPEESNDVIKAVMNELGGEEID